jgi:uncharacterized membrane protein YjgN (DUF898 family)
MARSGRFRFDGGAGTYVGTAILAFLITVFTLGICYPFALVLRERWRAKHSLIDGQRLVFTGSAWGLFGNWLKWFLLMVVTLGIYSFWVGPRIAQWKWEHTDFAPSGGPGSLSPPAAASAPLGYADPVPSPAESPAIGRPVLPSTQLPPEQR